MSSTSAQRMVVMLCPNLKCRRPVMTPEEIRGQTVRCAHCNTPFRVPLSRDPAPTEHDDKSAGPAQGA